MAGTYRATGYLRKVLSEDEIITRITRRHWIVRVLKTMWWALTFWAMLAGAVWLYNTTPAGDDRWVWVAVLALIPLGGWVWEHLVWRNQMNVMTNRRIIQMEGVLNKKVADSLLEKLNDVKTEQSLIGRIMGFGDILILTASEQGANQLKTVADPLGFKRAMLDAKVALDDEHDRPRSD